MHLYLATDLAPAHEDRVGPDEDERLELERRPIAEAVAAAERGEIADAKSLVALFWLDRLDRLRKPMTIAPHHGILTGRARRRRSDRSGVLGGARG